MTTGTRRTRAERGAQFLDVAAELLTSEGIEAVTMETVAARSGVNKALAYRSYTNRWALLVALFEREAADLEIRVDSAMERAGEVFADRARAALDVWFDKAAERDGLLLALLRAGSSDSPLEQRRRAWRDQAVESWGRKAAEALGLPLPTALDAAAIVLAGLQGALERWLDSGRPRADVAETFVRVASAGLEGLAGG